MLLTRHCILAGRFLIASLRTLSLLLIFYIQFGTRFLMMTSVKIHIFRTGSSCPSTGQKEQRRDPHDVQGRTLTKVLGVGAVLFYKHICDYFLPKIIYINYFFNLRISGGIWHPTPTPRRVRPRRHTQIVCSPSD